MADKRSTGTQIGLLDTREAETEFSGYSRIGSLTCWFCKTLTKGLNQILIKSMTNLFFCKFWLKLRQGL
eukprot:10059100-Heterocapsa_arctica.AAC.1